MPYVDGGTLHDLLRARGPVAPPQAGRYLGQVAAALDYAHRRKIVHRDIKPQNMLIRSEDDRLLLSDFGIAKVLTGESGQSRTGVMGTLSYMAPEQFRRDRHHGDRHLRPRLRPLPGAHRGGALQRHDRAGDLRPFAAPGPAPV
jgi:serine/threonine protein kinase